MTLARKLDDEELSFLEVIEDPIWFAEFLRNTSDGAAHKEEWPKKKFAYRWYQRDLISDQSPFISLVAGRAVGKCNPANSRIYIVDEGYVSVRELAQRKASFAVYSLSKNGELVQRRANMRSNGRRLVFRVTTESGYTFDGTGNHPLLTQRGYVEIQDLKSNDEVAVLTWLPFESRQNIFSWYELRWLGYALGDHHVTGMSKIPLRYKKQVAELEAIAKVFNAKIGYDNQGYHLARKKGSHKLYSTQLLDDLGLRRARMNGIRVMPALLKRECLENIKIFLEAFISQWAEIKEATLTIKYPFKVFIQDIQELLLRFGIESDVREEFNVVQYFTLTLHDYRAFYRLFSQFKIPGISFTTLPLPEPSTDVSPIYRFDRIEKIGPASASRQEQITYSISVWEDHNYICDGLVVHNSLVLEDKIIGESVNHDLHFPVTKEQLLTTANMAQITPILDRLVLRFTRSPLLKDFLQNNVNRSKGTLDFPIGSTNYRINARIAGSRGENNLVGLHVNKIKIDESQLFPMPAYTQMLPTLNQWEPSHSLFLAGVPTGLREGNLLYFADRVSTKFKKYRIPAHQNPFFTLKDNIEAIKQHGGEDSEDYLHLVLGQHGNPAYSVIPRDSMRVDPYDFYSYRYNGGELGKTYADTLGLPKLNPDFTQSTIFAIDTGFTDPTIIQVIGYGRDSIWRTLIRYRLTRVPFPDQAAIINWLDNQYNPIRISLDLGAGGGGVGIMQDLVMSDRFPKSKKYGDRIHGVRFNDAIDIGEDSSGNPLKLQMKAFAGQQLAKMVAEKELIFSEIDYEGISQLERVAYQRTIEGSMRYFVLSDRGAGVSKDDHIFASYVVFIGCLTTMSLQKPIKRLFGSTWV